jgi:hypothetical protein
VRPCPCRLRRRGDGAGHEALEAYGYALSASLVDPSFNRLKGEITAGRPVIMSGSGDCTDCVGHAFVVTGVRDSYTCSTGFFPQFYKINWGWAGSHDGWYQTLDLTPDDDDYRYYQKVVFGIHP